MPIYEIQHAIPLTISQRDDLASAITTIHSTKFITPKLFVQVFFTDISERHLYIGGKRRTGNHICGQVRTGPSRSQSDWDDLCKQLSNAWYQVCGTPIPTRKGGKEPGDTTLGSVIVMGGMVAGLEQGFVLPGAGGDIHWLEDNMSAFQEKADEGNEDMQDLVKDVKERGLLDGTNGYKV